MKTCRLLACVSLLIAAGMAATPSSATSGETLPGMSVQLEIIKLPVEFGIAPGSAQAREIEAGLSRHAITTLRKAFPFMGWDSPGTLDTNIYRKVAALQFRIEGDSAIGGGRVTLTCMLLKSNGDEIPIPVEPGEVYSKDSSVPTFSTLVSTTVENGQNALTSLITDQKQKWLEKLISHVPLGVTIRDRPVLKSVIVLIPASVLCARNESEILVQYQSEIPGLPKVEVHLYLSPYGPVLEDPDKDMQQCLVLRYECPGQVVVRDYDPHIGKSLMHALAESLKVFVTKHVRDSDGIADGLF
jgi:hypothetical protein